MNHILCRSFFATIGFTFLVSCATKVQDTSSIAIDTYVADTTAVTSTEPKPTTSEGPYQPAATRLVDLIHTKLKVRFDWAKQHLLGEATLTLMPYFYPQNQIILDAKGFDIHKVTLLKGGKELDVEHTYDQKQLIIKLDKVYTRRDTLNVFISYTAKPNELKIKGSDAITADKGLYFINPLGKDKQVPQQIWTQGETESSSCWFPTIDKPNERMTQEFYITVDNKFKTLSNGRLASSKRESNGQRTDYWRMDLPHAPYLAMMAVGDFAVIKDKWHNKEVSYWVEPAYANTARSTFGRTPEMMEYFSQKLGVPFIWNKYAQVVVRDFVSGAMENTTASTFMEELQQDKRQLLDTNWDHIIAHELFHQWFGDLVTTESWANLPLNESFADYSEYLWAEYKYGMDEAALVQQTALQQYLNEAKIKQEPLIRYHYYDKEDMFDSHSYAKGGRVLHMLRKQVGDDAFFAALQKYLKQHQFKSVEIADLRLAFEEVTGQDLNWFFNQWFLMPGHPDLKIDTNYKGNKLIVDIKQLQDSSSTPIYRLSLPIALQVKGQWQTVIAEITKAHQELQFDVEEQPSLVVIDPEQVLLGNVTHNKSAQEWLLQFEQRKEYPAKAEALKQLKAQSQSNEFSAAIKKAMLDPFWRIRSNAVELLSETEVLKEAEIQEKLKSLALNDKHPSVRAMAIYMLSTGGTEKHEALFKKTMRDSSYQVVAASVYAWGTEKQNPEELKFLLNENNPEVVNALAANLTKMEGEEVYKWYLKQANQVRRHQLFYFLQGFGSYLLRKSSAEQEKGWEILKKISASDQPEMVKKTAYETLVLLADTEIRKQEIQTLVNSENDEAWKEWWEQQKQFF